MSGSRRNWPAAWPGRGRRAVRRRDRRARTRRLPHRPRPVPAASKGPKYCRRQRRPCPGCRRRSSRSGRRPRSARTGRC
ncbi:hypothetical protein EOA32_19725 [Mesorhizobium sp. M1A.F.Ca.ET.072.01.1.1]|nr:hypothetical protein EOA32_19725 [Mesorhizobium sp. M1A.F.Ca.ET.072.01.1.1]